MIILTSMLCFSARCHESANEIVCQTGCDRWSMEIRLDMHVFDSGTSVLNRMPLFSLSSIYPGWKCFEQHYDTHFSLWWPTWQGWWWWVLYLKLRYTFIYTKFGIFHFVTLSLLYCTNLGPYSNLLAYTMVKLKKTKKRHIKGINNTATNMDITVEITIVWVV